MYEGLVKGLRSHLPMNLKYGVAFGKIYTQTYVFLKESQYWSRDRHLSYQLSEAQKLIAHAYANVPYYHQLLDDGGINPGQIKDFSDIAKIPFLTKEIIQKNIENLVARNVPKSSIGYGSTGGSTGVPTWFYSHWPVTSAKEEAFVRLIYDRIHYVERQREVVLRGSNVAVNEQKNIYWENAPTSKELHFSSCHINEDTFPYYLNKIKQFRPLWIRAFPSSLYLLGKHIERTGNNPFDCLKGIILSSENIYLHQKELFAKIFPGVRVFGFYGHSERCCVAGECEQNDRYHVQSEYGYTEFVQDGQYKEIVATGFNNYVMPFIRYRTQDYVDLSDQTCSCGRHYQLIETMVGREQEYLYTADKTPISFASLNMHGGFYNQVYKIQFIQSEYGKCTVLLVPGKEFSQQHMQLIVQNLNDKFMERMEMEVKLVEDIPTTKSGKQRPLLQQLDIQ